MARNLFIGIIILFALVIGFNQTVFMVDQTEQAIVLKFGNYQRTVREPGLALKSPLESVVKFDTRALDLEMDKQEVLATDKQRLIVDAFARYVIVDPLKTYQSVTTAEQAGVQLASILGSKLRNVLGRQAFADIISAERTEVMHQILDDVNVESKTYGVRIVDVRIKRADLPTEGGALDAAFERMRSERQQEALGIKADGQRRAQEIQADADAQAARTYADAFNKDPDFYAFYRSMTAYSRAVRKSDTSFVLTPDSAFMKAFQQGK